jgi:hypothetical protein
MDQTSFSFSKVFVLIALSLYAVFQINKIWIRFHGDPTACGRVYNHNINWVVCVEIGTQGLDQAVSQLLENTEPYQSHLLAG